MRWFLGTLIEARSGQGRAGLQNGFKKSPPYGIKCDRVVSLQI